MNSKKYKIYYFLGGIFCLILSVLLIIFCIKLVSWTLTEKTFKSDKNNITDHMSDIIYETIKSDEVLYIELELQSNCSKIKVNYSFDVIDYNIPFGFDILFMSSENNYYKYLENSSSYKLEYTDCNKTNVLNATGDCIINNGGGIVLHNISSETKKIKLNISLRSN